MTSCNYRLSLVLQDLARISINKESRINLLKSSIFYLSEIVRLTRNIKERLETSYGAGLGGKFSAKLGEALHELSLLTKDEKTFQRAIETYKQSLIFYRKAEMPTHTAESCWHLSQLYDQIGEFSEASSNYERASQAYERASKKIPQLKKFYRNILSSGHLIICSRKSTLTRLRITKSLTSNMRKLRSFMN